MRFSARAAAAVVALPLVLGVAACGVTDKPTAGPKPAAAKTTPAPLKAPTRLTAASFSPAMNAANAKAKSMESVVRINADGQVITMTMAQTLKPFATKLEMSSPALGGAAHIISIKSALYVSAPNAAPAGKYLKINLKTTKDPALASLGEMLEGADPVKSVKSWDKALRKVTFVRTETLGFRKVNRYQVTVDNTVALGLSAKKLSAVGLQRMLVYTVWVGADNLMYKMAYKMGSMDMQITVSSYNATSTIKPPPATKIYTR